MVTVTGVDGAVLDRDSDVVANLRTALRRHGDPSVRIQVLPAERLALKIRVSVGLQPDHGWSTVEPRLRAALLDAFGPTRRELAQRLTASEVVAVLQAVPGVRFSRGLGLQSVNPDGVFDDGGGHPPLAPGPRCPARRAERPAAGPAPVHRSRAARTPRPQGGRRMTPRGPQPAADRLFDLLPLVHRMRDEAAGHPLRDLLRVVAEQVQVVEEDIARQYENWFVETAEDWVVPYLADLVGWTPVPDAGWTAAGLTGRDLARRSALAPRQDVADTLRHRRRKGTRALLEDLALDVAGLPGHAVEAYRLLARHQQLNHQQADRGRTADLRAGTMLDRLGGPFDALAHTVDVRRPGSHRTAGLHNIPGVGLYVPRLRAYPVTHSQAGQVERVGRWAFTFDPAGFPLQLFGRGAGTGTGAVTGTGPGAPGAGPDGDRRRHPQEPADLPAPIDRRALGRLGRADPRYYGEGRSLVIHAPDWPRRGEGSPVPADRVVPADLGDWDAYRPLPGTVAVDPVLGRMLFPGATRRATSGSATTTAGPPTSAAGSTRGPCRSRPRPTPTASGRPTSPTRPPCWRRSGRATGRRRRWSGTTGRAWKPRGAHRGAERSARRRGAVHAGPPGPAGARRRSAAGGQPRAPGGALAGADPARPLVPGRRHCGGVQGRPARLEAGPAEVRGRRDHPVRGARGDRGAVPRAAPAPADPRRPADPAGALAGRPARGRAGLAGGPAGPGQPVHPGRAADRRPVGPPRRPPTGPPRPGRLCRPRR
ncbi:hypothetical protein ACFQ0M_09125 [Kitasatospora aburaviensis]